MEKKDHSETFSMAEMDAGVSFVLTIVYTTQEPSSYAAELEVSPCDSASCAYCIIIVLWQFSQVTLGPELGGGCSKPGSQG